MNWPWKQNNKLRTKCSTQTIIATIIRIEVDKFQFFPRSIRSLSNSILPSSIMIFYYICLNGIHILSMPESRRNHCLLTIDLLFLPYLYVGIFGLILTNGFKDWIHDLYYYYYNHYYYVFINYWWIYYLVSDYLIDVVIPKRFLFYSSLVIFELFHTHPRLFDCLAENLVFDLEWKKFLQRRCENTRLGLAL